MITVTENKLLHWNYFLALERDLETASRYIELSKANFEVFSIELAHLLFAAASEVDVLAKCICGMVAPTEPRGNIDHYRKIIMRLDGVRESADVTRNLSDIGAAEIRVPRYGLSFKPWEHWSEAEPRNPDWWHSYNAVKHERNEHFKEANLKNALNALGALLIMNYHYYRLKAVERAHPDLRLQLAGIAITGRMQPESILLRLPCEIYGLSTLSSEAPPFS
jgi:hypothetical protein